MDMDANRTDRETKRDSERASEGKKFTEEGERGLIVLPVDVDCIFI